METSGAVVKPCSLIPSMCSKPDELGNGNASSTTTIDSDYEYRKRNGFCLTSQRKPKASLRFILTGWYSPETSAAIAEAISSRFSESELQELLSGPAKNILPVAEYFYADLGL